MVDFTFITEKKKKIARQRGYSVDLDALSNQLKNDEQRLRLYKQVFSTKEGRWVLTDLMVEGGLLSSFEADNSLKLAHSEGRRSVAIRIASNIGLTFEQVMQAYFDIGKEDI